MTETKLSNGALHEQADNSIDCANDHDPLSLSIRSNYSFSKPESLAQLRPERGSGVLPIITKAENRQLEKTMAELTINKLKFNSMGLIGREQEIATLKSCYRSLETQKSGESSQFSSQFLKADKDLVLLHGFSGVGKSKLAETVKEEVAASKNAMFAEGKYDFVTMDEPFSGIVQAYGSLCNQIKDSELGIREAVKLSIMENMEQETEMLKELIPELGSLFNNQDIDCISANNSLGMSNEKRQEHWRHAFRVFTRILGSFFHPIVIVLDDLQWADVASLDVLEYLISDVQNPYPLMIIGCYRSNEVNENSILYNRMQDLREKTERFAFRITEIEVKSCDMDAVNKMIMSMMSIDDEEKTRELAEVCFKRTLGNPFFLIEFMKMLQTEGLLEFHLGLMKWVYNVSKIEDATMSTANVVDLLHTRMRKLSDDMQVLLQYAACLGSSFSPSTLQFVWKENRSIIRTDDVSNVDDMLKLAEQANFMEPCGTDQLRWVHDKVQEAALSLSDLVTPAFQFQLGLCLYHGLEKKELDKRLFDITDLINKGAGVSREELATLNLRAAKKAQRTSAFLSASKYIANGIRFLPSDSWDTDRWLPLQLYSRGAEIELALGRTEKVDEYVGAVRNTEACTLIETMPVQVIKMRSLVSQVVIADSINDHALALLKKLGFQLVWNRKLVRAQALTLAIRTIKKVKRLSVHHFASLRKMKDPKQRAILNILSIVRVVAFKSKNVFLSMMCACKMVELTLAHGVSDMSGASLGGLANAAFFLKHDHAATLQISEMAFAVHERHGGSRVAETTYTICAHCLARVKPLHECLPMMMKGYSHGARSGEIEWSVYNLMMCLIFFPYVMGKTLDQILEQFPKILPQVEEAELKVALLIVRTFWQLVVKLQLVPSDKAAKLDGDIFKQDNKVELNPVHARIIHLAQGELFLFYGHYQTLANRDIEKGDLFADSAKTSFMIPMEAFHRGIALYAMAKRTKVRKYRTRANRLQKRISKWAKEGNPNVKHYDLMLRAEQASLNRRYGVADYLYKEAIIQAARTGHLHHAALFHERYAEYRLKDHGDVDDGKYHLAEAVRYYSEWGAVGKAEVLRKEMEAM
mmetsp:Transcript_3756/g.8624  ORF Transcript_3756/g.8624 Transcript_3756/m.8624 type:complete len:1095 (+) Transcript_3756:156-3440(+)